jgi:hypothetical protein
MGKGKISQQVENIPSEYKKKIRNPQSNRNNLGRMVINSNLEFMLETQMGKQPYFGFT